MSRSAQREGDPSSDDGTPHAAPPHRPIRSFVLRQGRLSPAQARALDALLPRFGVDYAPNALDFERTFGRRAPVVLEIGFGMGETTAAIAQTHPQVDFLGVEVHAPGVGALLRPAFVRALAERLAPGGYLHAATDWEEYAQEILATFAAEPLLANTADGFAPRPPWRPQTKFEVRGAKLGHGSWDIVFRRR